MPIRVEVHRRSRLADDERQRVEGVDRLGRAFVDYLRSIDEEVDRAHVHGARSDTIQALMTEWLVTKHGFRAEVIGAFDHGRRLRPDFVGEADGGGVLVEVERGGTVTNNHDLKDIWKCHLCETTQHLFLLVPNANWTRSGAVRERPFLRSSARLKSFFEDPRTYIDVLSTWVIGYGLLDAVSPEDAARSTAADDEAGGEVST